MIFDKVVDMLVATVTATALGVSALGTEAPFIATRWQPAILILSVAPRNGFSVLSWLKDSHLHKLSHARRMPRRNSIVARAKTVVGNVTDDVPWRLGVCGSWATGYFWEFTLAFNAALSLVFLLYLATTKRDMDAHDRAGNGGMG
jgi:hypothetical protein